MLRKFLNVVALSALSITGSIASAEEYIPPAEEPRGDAAAAAAQVVVCNACHGAEGQAILGDYPNLGGQHYDYLLRQMRAFKSGERSAVLMTGQLEAMDDDMLENFAAFYAEKDEYHQVAPAGADVALGERIWRAGIAAQGVPACAACHGPAGAGNGPAGFPALAGQNAGYTALQLRAYRDGSRATDEGYGQMMRGIAAAMSDEDIEAVSAYAQGTE
jgi:cytochrome c553